MRDIWRIAHRGDADALSRIAFGYYRAAAGHPDTLSAFGIGDSDYLERWMSPPAFDPALVAVLAWIPEMTVLAQRDADAVATLRWTDAAVKPASATLFHSLYAILARIAGPQPTDTRRLMGLGDWARVSTLGRYLRDASRRPVLDELADPQRTWLVVNTLW